MRPCFTALTILSLKIQFVRIEPGSILQLLYPCSRYSPDSCLFCGGNFADHMALAWSKHLYTPLDRYLDDVRQQGVVTTTTALAAAKSRRGRRRSRASSAVVAAAPSPPRHVFHRRYVQDQEQLLAAAVANKKNRQRRRASSSTTAPRTFLRQCQHVTYRIPFTQVTLLRAVVLSAVESLIRMEQADDQQAAAHGGSSSCC